MNSSKHDAEALWAYVHGESDPETRESLKAALRNDPALAGAEKQIRALHGSLQRGLSAPVSSDDALISEITAAWEVEHESLYLSPQMSGDAPQHEQTRRHPRFNIWHSGLAIAACLLIMMGVHTLHPQAALTWNEPSITKSRGQENTAAIYNDFEVAEMHGLLVSEVGSAYEAAEKPGDQREAWRLSTALSIRPDRSFTLSVKAQNRFEEDQVYAWDDHYDGLDDYRARVSQLADEVVDGLTGNTP